MKLDDRRAAGQLQEMINTPNLSIKGRVAVDILNERGRVIDRQEADNYVNQAMWERWARHVQKVTFWNQLRPTNPTLTPDYNRDPRATPALYNEIFACWTDSSAEDPTDLYIQGEVIAWAHKFGQAAISSRQGVSNAGLHELSEDSIKWGWEWLTTNGNGTFQSVGWQRLGWASPTGNPMLWHFPNYSGRYISGFANTVFSGDPCNVQSMNGASQRTYASYYNSDDSSLYVSGRTTTLLSKMTRLPVTFVNGQSFTVGTQVDMSADPIFASGAIEASGSVSINTRQTLGITRLGPTGDWFGCGTTGGTTARRPWIRRVDSAGTVAYTNVNVATFATESWLTDLTYDGTDIWGVGGLVGVNRLYRFDASNGNVDATVTVSGLPSMYSTMLADSTCTFMGVEWDATNNWFWIEASITSQSYTFAVDASGVWQGVWLSPRSPATVALVAPTVVGNYNFYANGDSGQYTDVDYVTKTGQNSLSTTATGSPAITADAGELLGYASAGGGGLISMNGHIWRAGAAALNATSSGTAHSCGWYPFTVTPNFFSRSLLGAPVTKTSSDAMRITYEMSFS